ncbi:bifunctional riboflavin kinase/FAD synthetase [Boudabousia marimammalium]|uniref:Riboflavin biosynthesis protein n=1 Tax=Boudabousia marimammalium TaxID=156892 RepID=A0A1Q5PPE8_9ACTO|nr:bifunctional riboflavin kinase/FAD synthetase [Boudabousia marimammalium]OKL49275.1 riboflavin biosynthesis protein RibF [Boudabousia marimammalium]
MQVCKALAQVPEDTDSVATIGIFDGVHLGHRRLVKAVVERAKARNVQAWAITFDPHPATLHQPERGVRLIMSLSDRLATLSALGLDGVLVEPYTRELSSLSPRQFVERYFVKGLGVKEVIVGQDVRFGHDNCGDIHTLFSLGEEFGFTVTVVSEQTAKSGRRYSSTWVREALKAGDVAQVKEILGSPHRVRGQVVHGFKRGRELGFPTANLDAETVGEIPGDGVYAGWLVRSVPNSQHAYERLAAAISVGTNPHFDGEKRTIEAHVLGRSDLNLYGENVGIEFIKKLRGMQSFDCLDDLLNQMDEDLRAAAELLSVPAAGRVNPAAVTAR